MISGFFSSHLKKFGIPATVTRYLNSGNPMPWYFCSDWHHLRLAQLLAADLNSSKHFDPRFIYCSDLGGNPRRAAGGFTVMEFKIKCILDCLNQIKMGETFVWSDVDVRPVGEIALLRSLLDECAKREKADIWTQREFENFGVNVGFMVLRNSDETRMLFRSILTELNRTKALDQNIFNSMIINKNTQGAKVRLLPSTIWTSSNVEGAPPLHKLHLHHANFIVSELRTVSTDPVPKLSQIDHVQKLYRNKDTLGWLQFLSTLSHDSTLGKYKHRYFPLDDRRKWEGLLEP